MNILEYLPGVLLIFVLAVWAGMMARLLIEGASIKGATLGVLRMVVLPLAAVIVINTLYDQRRRIIFDLRHSTEEVEEKFIEKFEHTLNSKLRLTWLVVSSVFNSFRSFIDFYVKQSVEYERFKAKNLSIKTKKPKNNNFFDHFIGGADLENHLFHSH